MPSLRNFIREIYQIWVSEKPNQLAAALAYFGVFSFSAVIYLAFLIADIFINETAAKEAGADFVHKGASPDELIATLESSLKKQGKVSPCRKA